MIILVSYPMPEFKVKNIYAICKILAMGATKFITGKKKEISLANIIIQIIGNTVSKKFSNYDTQF